MKVVKGIGGCLTLLGVAGFLLAIFMFLDPLEGDTRLQSLLPGAFFGSVLFLPGVVLFLWGRARGKRAEFENQVAGMLRTHDRFSIAEMARKISRDEMQTEALVVRLARREGLDLVFHRPSREYMHRARVPEARRVVETCPSCGAVNGRQVVFGNEEAVCSYCSHPLPVE